MAKKDVISRLSEEEQLLIGYWKDIQYHLRIDLAHVWSEDVGKALARMKKESTRIQLILKKLEKAGWLSRPYYKKLNTDIVALEQHIEHRKPSVEWIRLVHDDLQGLISDVRKITGEGGIGSYSKLFRDIEDKNVNIDAIGEYPHEFRTDINLTHLMKVADDMKNIMQKYHDVFKEELDKDFPVETLGYLCAILHDFGKQKASSGKAQYKFILPAVKNIIERRGAKYSFYESLIIFIISNGEFMNRLFIDFGRSKMPKDVVYTRLRELLKEFLDDDVEPNVRYAALVITALGWADAMNCEALKGTIQGIDDPNYADLFTKVVEGLEDAAFLCAEKPRPIEFTLFDPDNPRKLDHTAFIALERLNSATRAYEFISLDDHALEELYKICGIEADKLRTDRLYRVKMKIEMKRRLKDPDFRTKFLGNDVVLALDIVKIRKALQPGKGYMKQGKDHMILFGQYETFTCLDQEVSKVIYPIHPDTYHEGQSWEEVHDRRDGRTRKSLESCRKIRNWILKEQDAGNIPRYGTDLDLVLHATLSNLFNLGNKFPFDFEKYRFPDGKDPFFTSHHYMKAERSPDKP